MSESQIPNKQYTDENNQRNRSETSSSNSKQSVASKSECPTEVKQLFGRDKRAVPSFLFGPFWFQALEEAAAAAKPTDSTLNNGLDDKDNDKDAKKKKNRCATCRKKVGLTGTQVVGQLRTSAGRFD